MKPEWCSEETWISAKAASVLIFDQLLDEGRIAVISMDARDQAAIPIARALLDAHQRGRREGMEEAGTDITERLRLRSLAINEALVEQRDVDAAVLMSCDLPNIPAAAIRAKAQEVT